MFYLRKKWFKKSAFAGKCAAVIVAAGSSRRMRGINKQFALLSGVPALAHTLKAFQDCSAVSEIIVVSRSEDIERIAGICDEYGITKAVSAVVGGETRLDSVLNGVSSVSKNVRLIAIHDGARPCITADIIRNTINAAHKYHAAAPVVPVTSTLKMVKNGVITETVSRECLYEVQTPQVFSADLIKAALKQAKDNKLNITDDCMAVEALGVPVHITEGSRDNIKLTTKGDIAVAELFINKTVSVQAKHREVR